MKNSKKKLALKKKTVFNLNDQDLKNTKGGKKVFDASAGCTITVYLTECMG